MTLVEQIDNQIALLQAEATRIKAQARVNLDDVDRKVEILKAVKKAITPEVEAAVIDLQRIGLWPGN